jgi:hypothetical protein
LPSVGKDTTTSSPLKTRAVPPGVLDGVWARDEREYGNMNAIITDTVRVRRLAGWRKGIIRILRTASEP